MCDVQLYRQMGGLRDDLFLHEKSVDMLIELLKKEKVRVCDVLCGSVCVWCAMWEGVCVIWECEVVCERVICCVGVCVMCCVGECVCVMCCVGECVCVICYVGGVWESEMLYESICVCSMCMCSMWCVCV